MPFSDGVKPGHSGDQSKHKQLDRQLLDMVSSITHRMSHLHKPSGSTVEEEDDGGVRVITLAGSNIGATMRGHVGEKDPHRTTSSPLQDDGDESETEEDQLITYVNSNVQAVNNSVMFGGSYATNDPGVHVDISQLALGHRDLHHHHHNHNQKKRGLVSSKKKEKGPLSSDHPSSALSDYSSH